MYILGISCFYHDAAVCLLKDGKIVACSQEERFTRIKHDPSFPKNAISFCLKKAGIKNQNLDYIGFYEKPFLKFERLLATYLKTAPLGLFSFLKAMPLWLKERLWLKTLIQKELGLDKEIIFLRHHLAHAGSSFLVSPFEKAAILTMDGVGEWETTAKGWGKGNKINLTHAINFPHSLGLLYSAFTLYCGFKINSGEYKLMGLAPNGKPKYVQKILDNLIDLKEDGSFALNMNYFTYEYSLSTFGEKFERFFGRPALPLDKLPHPQFYCDIASSIQKVTEMVILKMVHQLYKETKLDNLCLAGGVALNCVANGCVLKETKFKNLFIQPAAGDAGGALGTAFYIYNTLLGKKRNFVMEHCFWGPEYKKAEIKDFLDQEKIPYYEYKKEKDFLEAVAKILKKQKIIGWFQGKMEWGPRALGNRSILADARNPKMKDILNAKIKHREPFRPFAPVVLEEKIKDYFELNIPTPFMLLTAQVKKTKPSIPAVTHVDNSARIQSISFTQNPRYYKLIKEFDRITGCPVLVNTSFNVRGEPIVRTPKEAYNCFMGTDMDYLGMDLLLLDKRKMRVTKNHRKFKEQFSLD